MTPRASPFAVALLAAALWGGTGARAQDAPPVRDAPPAGVPELLDEADRAFEGDPDAPARVGYRLSVFGPPALGALREAAASDRPGRTFAALRALVELGEPETAAARALDLAAAGEMRVRVPAAETLAALSVRLGGPAGEAARRRISEKLPPILHETFEPEVKIPLIVALWHAKRDPLASAELKQYLRSEEPEVAARAALALGECGNVAAARALLERLRGEPTPRGRLAAALLDREMTAERLAALEARAKTVPVAGDEVLEELRQKILEHYPDTVEAERVLAKAVQGIVRALDPASAYLEKPTGGGGGPAGTAGTAGVGLRIGEREGLPVVMSVRSGSPAERSGLRPRDRVFRVGDRRVVGEEAEAVEDLLRGEPGTSVEVEFHREQEPRWLRGHKVTLGRVVLPPPPVVRSVLPGGIGHVRLEDLGPATAAELRGALGELSEARVRGLVLDLRSLSTGSREQLLETAAPLLGGGAVVYQSRGRNPALAALREWKTEGGPAALPPTVALIGAGTAGPGELLAAAMRHHGRTRLVGSKTFGESQEVQVFPLRSTGGRTRLRLPVLVHLAPDGGPIHGVGVRPDHEVADPVVPGWVETERETVRRSGEPERFAARLLERMDPAAARALAESDGGDVKRYPGFAEWHAELRTRAEPEHLRPLVRAALRELLAGKEGRAPPDPREDPPLAAAVLLLLEQLGQDPAAFPLYAGLSR